MKKLLATALLGLAAMAPITALPAAAQSVATEQTAEQTAVFAIDNMTCALCPITVRRAMEAVDGVTSVAVDFDAKTATVTFDAGATDTAAIAAASTNAGYPAHVAG